MAVSITMSGRTLKAMSSDLAKIPAGMQKAIKRASRRVATQGKALIAKKIIAEVVIKSGDVKKQVDAKPVGTGMLLTLYKEKRTPLKYFNAKQTQRGVTYKISKTGRGKTLVPGAFIVQSLGGHAFVRSGGNVQMTKGRYKGRMRQRIFKLFGVSAWAVFVKQSMTEPVAAELRKSFDSRLRHEIDFLIQKAKGNP